MAADDLIRLLEGGPDFSATLRGAIRGVCEAVEMRDINCQESSMEKYIDWEGCDVVERVTGKRGGRPVVKGTRIEPETIIVDEEFGRTPEQTHASFPTLSIATILKIRAFVQRHQLVP